MFFFDVSAVVVLLWDQTLFKKEEPQHHTLPKEEEPQEHTHTHLKEEEAEQHHLTEHPEEQDEDEEEAEEDGVVWVCVVVSSFGVRVCVVLTLLLWVVC